MDMGELRRILLSTDRSFNEDELKTVMDEILNVFRIKKAKEETRSPTPTPTPRLGIQSSASTGTLSTAPPQDKTPGTDQSVRMHVDEAQASVKDANQECESHLPMNTVPGSSAPQQDSSATNGAAATAQTVDSSNTATWKVVRSLQHTDRCHPYRDSPSRRGS